MYKQGGKREEAEGVREVADGEYSIVQDRIV